MYYGGSYPPGWKGWQRQIRNSPFQLPRQAPYFWTASMKYRLQVGVNRQLRPSQGLIRIW
jgi:hypothetical protein